MQFKPLDPPRKFEVSGAGLKLELADCGSLDLNPDEQVTFTTDSGGQYDVTRKSWGFYATPSINGRLKSFGLRGALVVSKFGKIFLMLVEAGKESEFFTYINSDLQSFLCWLDEDQEVERITRLLKK
ncbi:hypothetical protein NHB34_01720 [Polynucleobacter sp. MWH-UH19D]|uniref:hypothetical protein n=1 Tax=Polynucleobacter sp. MWH-UH19D TaxID=1855610 RepID=UPI003364F631